MNKNVEDLLNSIHEPTVITDDESECSFRRNIARNYLSYQETIYTGERSKQDSLKKIHDYAKIWGFRNALTTLLEDVLPEPAEVDFDDIDDGDDLASGENRERVLDMFYDRFDFDEFDEDIPKLKRMFNVLVDKMLTNELSEHDLEMVAIDIWSTEHSDIG